MSEERDRLAEEVCKGYELYDKAGLIRRDKSGFVSYATFQECGRVGFKAGFDAGVESEKKKAKGLVEALEKLDQRLCENIIDPSVYDPLKEDKLSLVITVRTSSYECEWMLSKVRQALAAYKQEIGEKK